MLELKQCNLLNGRYYIITFQITYFFVARNRRKDRKELPTKTSTWSCRFQPLSIRSHLLKVNSSVKKVMGSTFMDFVLSLFSTASHIPLSVVTEWNFPVRSSKWRFRSFELMRYKTTWLLSVSVLVWFFIIFIFYTFIFYPQKLFAPTTCMWMCFISVISDD